MRWSLIQFLSFLSLPWCYLWICLLQQCNKTEKKTASFCFSDLYLRKAHKFSNGIHKWKTRPSSTSISSKLQPTPCPPKAQNLRTYLSNFHKINRRKDDLVKPAPRRGLGWLKACWGATSQEFTTLRDSEAWGRDENRTSKSNFAP